MKKTRLEDMHMQAAATCDREDLVDIAAIRIRQDLSHNEKVLAFLEEIKNPYYFLCGDVPVRVSFCENGPTLANALQQYFIRIKHG